MLLKEDFSLIQRGSKLISGYLDLILSYANELALIDVPLYNDDITIYVLNGLGPKFGDIVASIQAREHPWLQRNTRVS